EWIEDFNKEMKKSNRNILLILDGASLHVIGAVTLINVKVLKLPPYVTSKIQPMDAGIIASFKTHYHRMQLQHALDFDEAGKRDIYKVDQLQAMRWVKVSINVEESLFVDSDDELATMELQQMIDALCIRNPMPIKD
ncbi:15503_t:CDS:2, partial [Racocetra persica]